MLSVPVGKLWHTLPSLVALLGLLLAVDGIYVAGGIETPLPLDSDGDGCTDAEELGSQAVRGGQRDPANRYDFFDVPFRDQSVNTRDLFGVVAHFGASAANPAGPLRYDPAFDRSALGPDPWDLGQGDGRIGALDILFVIRQFGHFCQTLPPYYTIANPAFTPLPGARAFYGRYSAGAYRIEVPDAWNGDLVLWAHGFRGSGGTLSVDLPPGRDELLARGFAWAATSYRENGYVPGYGARDTLALKDLFTQLIGAPSRTYLVGASMGGHVTTLSLEQAPDDYDGALALCGVVSGVEILDYFVATWLPVAGYVTGLPLPPSPETADPQTLIQLIGQALPLLGQPGSYTPAGQQFKSIITHYTGGPRPFASEGFDVQFLSNFFVLFDGLNALAKQLPTGRQGLLRQVATNVGTTYHIDPGLGLSDDAINAGVVRIAADPQAQTSSEFAEFVPMTGNLSAPLISLHGTGDLFVPISLEVSYLQQVQAAGRSDLLVQRAYRHAGHCAFNPEDVMQAFDDLVSWVETGVRPWGDDLSGDLSDVGR